LLEIEGGDHFTFSGGIRDEFPEVKDYLARDSRRATVVRYTEAFFDRYLRADAGALDSLRAGGAGVSTIASDLPS
jgi:hypothetical protein